MTLSSHRQGSGEGSSVRPKEVSAVHLAKTIGLNYLGNICRNLMFDRKGLFRLAITILASNVYQVLHVSYRSFSLFEKVNLKSEEKRISFRKCSKKNIFQVFLS